MSTSKKSRKESIRCPACQKMVPVGYSTCPYCGTDLRQIFRLKATFELSIQDSLRRIKQTLTFSPTQIYSKIAVSPDYTGPMLIFLAISGLLTCRIFISSYTVLSFTFNWFSVLLIFTLTSLLTLLSFFLLSLVCNKILRLLGGSGKFDQTFSVLGYSGLPLVFAMFLTNFFLFFLASPKVGGSITFASNFIFLPFFVWFSYLAGTGLHFTHNLDRKLAFSVVFGLFLALTGFMMV